MSLVHFLKGLFSGAARAETIYQQGTKKAKKHDLAGAIGDYTRLIDAPHTSAELKARCLLNRGVAHAAGRNFAQARADLRNVLAGDDVPAEVSKAARAKLERIDRIERHDPRNHGATTAE
jgi:hypothetical protein